MCRKIHTPPPSDTNLFFGTWQVLNSITHHLASVSKYLASIFVVSFLHFTFWMSLSNFLCRKLSFYNRKNVFFLHWAFMQSFKIYASLGNLFTKEYGTYTGIFWNVLSTPEVLNRIVILQKSVLGNCNFTFL